eukprot:668809-Pyramimonas_sp.AAC.1
MPRQPEGLRASDNMEPRPWTGHVERKCPGAKSMSPARAEQPPSAGQCCGRLRSGSARWL